jgi:DNA-binding response OmpR family regulator
VNGGAALDALVTDIRLPQVDGWEIARRAREVHPELPVIYMSGDSAAEHRDHGVTGSVMLLKPFALDELLVVLTSALADSSRS